MMRVSEFAKRAGLPAGIVLANAKRLGLEVSSVLSALDEEDIATLHGWTQGLTDEARAALVAEAEASRRNRHAKDRAAYLADAAANRKAVEAHRRIALDAEAGRPIGPAMPSKAAPTPETAPPPEAPKAETAKAEAAEAAKAEQKPVPEAPKAEPSQAKPEPAPEAPKAETPAAMPEPKPAPEAPKAEAKPAPAKPTLTPTLSQARKPTLTPTKPTLTPTRKSTLTPTPKATPAEARPVSLGLSPTKKPPRPGEGRGSGGRDGRQDARGRQARGAEARPPKGTRPAGGTPAAKPASAPVALNGQTLSIHGPMTVKELAELLGTRPNLLIMDLMKLNVLASINQTLEPTVIKTIAEQRGYKVEMEDRPKRSAERKPQLKSEDADDEIPEDKPEDMQLRPPVVTFLGHVDHGKTTLMDYIRNAHVAAGEAGGITQHIAAYTIEVNQLDENGHKRLITFVDTPGHSAFESMRARGANITDIAVIIVAADDGVMPQTREAIKHARNAGVQMLVAVTKCDKPDANPMRVYQMLQAEGLTPSSWGGDIECCEVSGVTGQGVDDLLETILLQADVMELMANPNRRANGAVIESQLEQGLGPTATLLVKGGTLHVGDVVLCGEHYGKVRALIDERGKNVKQAGPSIAVKCTGLSGVPEAGSEFRVMLNEKRARELAEKTAEAHKLEALSAAQSASMSDWTKVLAGDEKAQLDVIVKGDTQGTAEAVVECLKGIESKKVSLKVLYSGVGSVTAADVQRAKGALIVGFGVNCEPGVQAMARQNGVRINTFRIIYELIEHVKRCMLDLIPPEYKEVVRGHAEVRQVFDISKLGKIAGCQMLDGMLKFKGKFRIFRGKHQIYDGAIATMKHFKDDVKEIAPAQECGLGFGSFEGFQEGDIVECYEMEELPKTL